MYNNDEKDNKFIKENEARPERYNYPAMSGNAQTFACPECGSYNTEQSTFYELCKTCGWHQGY